MKSSKTNELAQELFGLRELSVITVALSELFGKTSVSNTEINDLQMKILKIQADYFRN